LHIADFKAPGTGGAGHCCWQTQQDGQADQRTHDLFTLHKIKPSQIFGLNIQRVIRGD
jgi:hypothetical protein